MIIMTAALGPSAGLCLDCNYPLHGIPSGRCPECGREFDPFDPSTMNLGRPLEPWVVWVLGRMGLLVHLAVLAAAAITLWWARLPFSRVGGWCVATFVWLGLAGLWLGWAAIRTAIIRRRRWRHARVRTGLAQWLVMPILMIAVAMSVQARLPMRLAFRLSRPKMDSLVARVQQDPKLAGADQPVGVYTARKIHVVPGGVKFTVDESTVGQKSGFIYLPKVDPKTVGWHDYHYLYDGWWAWWQEG